MKVDAYVEIYWCNRNADGLIRVLQRLESFSIRPKQETKAYEVRLEEIRAAHIADFAETMAIHERADHDRVDKQRAAWEKLLTNSRVQ